MAWNDAPVCRGWNLKYTPVDDRYRSVQTGFTGDDHEYQLSQPNGVQYLLSCRELVLEPNEAWPEAYP